jgi:hypothetical protein
MRTFFSRFFFVLMMQLLVTPTFLMVPRESLLLWAGAYLILFILFILLSFATVQGKKHRLLVANTALELKKLLDMEEKVALGAKKITLECPACQKKTHRLGLYEGQGLPELPVHPLVHGGNR